MKTERIEIRLTPEDKNFLLTYCQKNNITISSLIRQIINTIKEEQKNAKKN